MPLAVRKDDTYTVIVPEHQGHDPAHTSIINGTATAGSANVFINGKAAQAVNMLTTEVCECGDDGNGTLSSGSPNVFVNGEAKFRYGDNIICHEQSVKQWPGTCSSNVYVNG
jgi:uncharacterized Zn-binding protein involved in type VI secretion